MSIVLGGASHLRKADVVIYGKIIKVWFAIYDCLKLD